MKVLIVDDHAVVRSGLVRLLGVLPQVEITEAADGRAALAWYGRSGPTWWCSTSTCPASVGSSCCAAC